MDCEPKLKKFSGVGAKTKENYGRGSKYKRKLVEWIQLFKKISEVDPNIQEN